MQQSDKPTSSSQIPNSRRALNWKRPLPLSQKTWQRCWGQPNGALTDGVPHLVDVPTDRPDPAPLSWRAEWKKVWDLVDDWVEKRVGTRWSRRDGALVVTGQPDSGQSACLRSLLLCLLEKKVLTICMWHNDDRATIFCDIGVYELPVNEIAALEFASRGVLLMDSTPFGQPYISRINASESILWVLGTVPDHRRFKPVNKTCEALYFVPELVKEDELQAVLALQAAARRSAAPSTSLSTLHVPDDARVPLTTLSPLASTMSSTRYAATPSRYEDLLTEQIPFHQLVPSPSPAPVSPIEPSSVATQPPPKNLHPLEIFHHLGPSLRYVLRRRERELPGGSSHPDRCVYVQEVDCAVADVTFMIKGLADGRHGEENQSVHFFRIFHVSPRNVEERQPTRGGVSYELVIPTATLRNLVRQAVKDLLSTEPWLVERAAVYCRQLGELAYEVTALRCLEGFSKIHLFRQAAADVLCMNGFYPPSDSPHPDHHPAFPLTVAMSHPFDPARPCHVKEHVLFYLPRDFAAPADAFLLYKDPSTPLEEDGPSLLIFFLVISPSAVNGSRLSLSALLDEAALEKAFLQPLQAVLPANLQQRMLCFVVDNEDVAQSLKEQLEKEGLLEDAPEPMDEEKEEPAIKKRKVDEERLLFGFVVQNAEAAMAHRCDVIRKYQAGRRW